MWWENECLSSREVSLYLAVAEPLANGHRPRLLLGTASSGEVHVAIGPDQFAKFLEVHAQATLICHDAATLHWQLHRALSGGACEKARETLWAFSRESRLVDIALLDRLVRHFEREGTTRVQSLQELADRYLGETLPDHETVCRTLRTIADSLSQPPSPESLELLTDLAKATFKVFQKLNLRANGVSERIRNRVLSPAHAFVEAQHHSEAITPQESIQSDTAHHPEDEGSIAPLGLGIDVKAAIALRNPARPALRTDSNQRPDDQERLALIFKAESARLHNDPRARKCFHWKNGAREIEIVAGQLKLKDQKLNRWLTEHAAMFRDIYNLPVEIPANVGGGPSLDPEQWGILADCDRSLNAWKRLNRCLGVLEAIDRDEVRPQFEIFPAICTHSPNLDAIRELGLPLFHPQPGHHFVVGTLSNLNLRAFAYVCSSNRYSHRSRLANYFYTRQCAKGASRAIAEELCATSSGKDLWDRLDGTASVNSRVDPKSVASSLSPKVTDDAKRFANLEKLLEAFALGLNDVHLRNLLQTRYDIDLPIGDIAALRSHLAAGKILDDFKDFWAEDVLLRLSSVLNVGVMDIANKFSGISYEDKTLDRAIQNALQPGSCSTAIRKHIEKLLLASSSPPEITVNDLGDIVRNRYGVTRAGRPIPPGNASDVKRQQVLLAADEAMKAVAYALGAEGFSLVAVAGDQFVLEVDENRAAEPGFTDQLEVLVAQSQVPILGSSLAAPCKWAVSDQWPMPTDD